MYYIYVLARPNGTPFYVGKGKGERIFDHEKEARSGYKSHKCNVIRKIWRDGGEVQRYTVFTSDDEIEALAYEQTIIALLGRHTLTNGTDGGEGMSGYVASKETRKKLSTLSKANWSDPEYRAIVTDAIRLRAADPEYRKLVSALSKARHTENPQQLRDASKSRWDAPDSHEHMSTFMQDLWAMPEWRETIRAAQKRAASTPERIALYKATSKGMWNDPDYRERLSVIHNSPEHRELLRENAHLQWEDPDQREKLVNSLRASKQDPAFRAEMSAIKKAQWADPEYRARMTAIRKEQGARQRAANAARRDANSADLEG